MPIGQERPPAFLVADHRALDFVNTRATPSGVVTEWLEDGRDLLDWLEQAGAIEAELAARFRADPAIDSVAERARDLRAWLRAFVQRHAGAELGPEALAELAPLNALLAEDDGYLQVGPAAPLAARATAAPAAGAALASARAAAAADRRSGRRSGLPGRLPPDPRLRGLGLHAVLPGPHQGARPALVQHGAVRQPGESGRLPRPGGGKAGLTRPLARARPSCTIFRRSGPDRPGRQPAREEAGLSGRDYQHAVRMENIQMAFGNVIALNDVNFEVGANEIVGLIGDNGAGKSTLIKIVTGVLKPSAGRLYIRDRLVDPERYSVRRAHDLRIEAVHQEKSLADKQPLWRNLFVGRQITNRFGFIDVKREKAVANQLLLEQIGFRGAGIDAEFDGRGPVRR